MLKEIYHKLAYPFNITKYRSLIKDSDAVLFNSPLHGNLGDHAIALCENAFLSALNIKVLDFPWFYDNYESVARSTPEDKLILISGGGYLGDLWPEEEYKVRKIIKAFAGRKTIILPQTVSFDLSDQMAVEFFEESKNAYKMNPDLILFVREKISFDFVKERMPGIDIRLVPDMAMLTKYESNVKREGALVCLRDDKESSILPDDKELVLQTLRSKYSSVEPVDTVIGNKLSKNSRAQAVKSMLDRFAGSEIVITDRLHGMIFAAVTATPCVVINSISHKITGCYEWLKDLGYIVIAENAGEISGLTDRLSGVKPEYNYEIIQKAFDPLKDELIKLTDSGVKP